MTLDCAGIPAPSAAAKSRPESGPKSGPFRRAKPHSVALNTTAAKMQRPRRRQQTIFFKKERPLSGSTLCLACTSGTDLAAVFRTSFFQRCQQGCDPVARRRLTFSTAGLAFCSQAGHVLKAVFGLVSAAGKRTPAQWSVSHLGPKFGHQKMAAVFGPKSGPERKTAMEKQSLAV